MFLHTIALPSVTQRLSLSFNDEFAGVVGVTLSGDTVLPSCLQPYFTVPGGLHGLFFLPQLGAAGLVASFAFSQPVVALVVALRSAQKPAPQSLVCLPLFTVGTYVVSFVEGTAGYDTHPISYAVVDNLGVTSNFAAVQSGSPFVFPGAYLSSFQSADLILL